MALCTLSAQRVSAAAVSDYHTGQGLCQRHCWHLLSHWLSMSAGSIPPAEAHCSPCACQEGVRVSIGYVSCRVDVFGWQCCRWITLPTRSPGSLVCNASSICHRDILPARSPGLDKTTGYVTTDNSGRGNIFPTTSKPFYKSPTSEKVASQGLGGLQGEQRSMQPDHATAAPCPCTPCAALDAECA